MAENESTSERIQRCRSARGSRRGSTADPQNNLSSPTSNDGNRRGSFLLPPGEEIAQKQLGGEDTADAESPVERLVRVRSAAGSRRTSFTPSAAGSRRGSSAFMEDPGFLAEAAKPKSASSRRGSFLLPPGSELIEGVAADDETPIERIVRVKSATGSRRASFTPSAAGSRRGSSVFMEDPQFLAEDKEEKAVSRSGSRRASCIDEIHMKQEEIKGIQEAFNKGIKDIKNTQEIMENLKED